MWRSRLVSLGVPILTLGICGCGSLSYHARHQYILVRSNPPGADVYYEGREVGTAPAFVEIRRGGLGAIQVLDGKSMQTHEIKSRYRWDGSFWSNFTWLYFAPVGWTVDWITGSAWNMNDPDPFDLRSPAAHPEVARRSAIAPPKADTVDISDEGGLLWEEQLPGQFPSYHLLQYQETLPEFASKGYDFDSRPGQRTEYELFAKLGISDVFESEFTETKNGVELHGRFRNVYSNQVGDEKVIKAVPAKVGEEQPWFERFKNLIHLVPNTIGLEWSNSDTQLTTAEGGNVYRSQPSNDETGWEKALPYLSAISFTRLNPPRREASGKFNFEFVPAIRTSYRRIMFPSFDIIKTNEFSYLNIGAGLGPEIGWQAGPNYFYLNWIPMFGWHRLAWERDDVLHVSSIGAVTQRLELGYLYFITDRFSGRLFVKNTTSPAQLWNSAIQDISPGGPTVLNGNDEVSLGIQFGYTLQPRREIRKWDISQ